MPQLRKCSIVLEGYYAGKDGASAGGLRMAKRCFSRYGDRNDMQVLGRSPAVAGYLRTINNDESLGGDFERMGSQNSSTPWH